MFDRSWEQTGHTIVGPFDFTSTTIEKVMIYRLFNYNIDKVHTLEYIFASRW